MVGAISAGTAKYLGETGKLNFGSRVAIGAASGGLTAAMQGSDFAEGVIQGAMTSAIADICNRLAGKAAEYLVVWEMASLTVEAGGLIIDGKVIDQSPSRDSDGNIIGYHALEFSSIFVGVDSWPIPLSYGKNIAIFKGNSPTNLYDIEGTSWIRNNLFKILNLTKFGNLTLEKMIPSGGFNLGHAFRGYIWAARSSFMISKESYEGYLNGKY